MRRTQFQKPLWLATGATTPRNSITQPEQYWYRTPGNHTVGGILVILYHLSAGSDLVFEGSNTDEGWFELARIVGSTFTALNKLTPIGMSANYPLSDGGDFLWASIRWRWVPTGAGTSLADQSVSFEAQVVTKP